MSKKRKRKQKIESKAQLDKSEHNRRGRPMIDIAIYALPVVSTVALAVAGMAYSSHKILAIRLTFAGVALGVLAIFLYWERSVTLELENPPFALAIETALMGATRDSGQVYCTYPSDLGKTISPVPLALVVRIVNLQNVPSKMKLLAASREVSTGASRTP